MTQVSMTERMIFLADNPPLQEIYVCESQLFSAIRKHIRALFSTVDLPDGDVRENEPALALRFEMTKWLTSPVMPDLDFFLNCGLANEAQSRLKWGEDAVREVRSLKDLIGHYRKEGSVLNEAFVKKFCDLIEEFGQDQIKIWCHRNDRDRFRELLEGLAVIDDHVFISSLAEYRSCPPVEALIRFGPLRTYGMARTPEALITSPAYRRLVRFIWKGLADEEGFAADPVVPTHNWLATMQSVRHYCVTSHSEADTQPLAEEVDDDFVFFANSKSSSQGQVRCELVELAGHYGVLQRPGANLLVFSPGRDDSDAINYRHINEVEEGDYLVTHDADADLGEVNVDVSKSPLAAVWKKALADLYKRQPEFCLRKMKEAGISLVNLHRAIESWISLTGSVIHAPQRRDHFQALLTRVLDPELFPPQSSNGRVVPSWSRAWAEVAASRSTAIEHGVLGSAIVHEQLIAALRAEISYLRDMISPDSGYRYFLSSDSGLVGSVRFDPVISIESDFSAPQEALGKPMRLLVAQQYRCEPGDTMLCA